MTTLYLVLCPHATSYSVDKQHLSIPKAILKEKGTFRVGTPMATGRSFISATSMTQLDCVTEIKSRQKIPTQKQLVDPFRQGIIVEGGAGYRQTVVIRSYEVGADKTATLESILNLLQETALNHVWVSGLLGDGFGTTHGMVRNNLIWVVTRMQVQVDDYPIWGEVMEVDTWVGASGKNGMRRDWLIKSQVTGQVFVRATSTWVMMNQKTRRLSKMPEEVRDEIASWFIKRKAIQEETHEKINRLDARARYINSNLKPKRSDLDMNHRVNNVKYVNWMLETIPQTLLENYQLSSMTLEYIRECGSSDTVQSLCEPEDESLEERTQDSMNFDYKNPFQRYIHLLQITGKHENEEIIRGRSTWKRRI